MVTLPWSCVLLILSETLLSVHSVLQGPQAAWCGGTQSPVSKHSSRALMQDGPFHALPSFARCTQDHSSCKTSTVLGFSPTLTPCAAWRTEKYVTLQDNQPACQQGKVSTFPHSTTIHRATVGLVSEPERLCSHYMSE